MPMLQRQRVSPRVQALELRTKYNSEPLSKDEFARVLFALENCGIPNAAVRLMDDSGRFALTELLRTI